jgi:N utilization substance protein B
MGTRRKSRELAMQMLFQGDLGKQTPEEVRALFWPSRDDVDAETRGFAEDLYRVATERQAEIDALIESHAENWRLERMAVVESVQFLNGVLDAIARDVLKQRLG